jgi:hypothetical protein
MFILPNLSSIAIYSRASNQTSTLFAYIEIWLMLKCCERKTLFYDWKVAQAKARCMQLNIAMLHVLHRLSPWGRTSQARLICKSLTPIGSDCCALAYVQVYIGAI